jgi:hypothetical protein
MFAGSCVAYRRAKDGGCLERVFLDSELNPKAAGCKQKLFNVSNSPICLQNLGASLPGRIRGSRSIFVGERSGG